MFTGNPRLDSLIVSKKKKKKLYTQLTPLFLNWFFDNQFVILIFRLYMPEFVSISNDNVTSGTAATINKLSWFDMIWKFRYIDSNINFAEAIISTCTAQQVPIYFEVFDSRFYSIVYQIREIISIRPFSSI